MKSKGNNNKPILKVVTTKTLQPPKRYHSADVCLPAVTRPRHNLFVTKALTTKLRNDWVQQNPGVDSKIYDDDNSKTRFFKPVTDINKFKYDVVK
jgi:hypothetical protein